MQNLFRQLDELNEDININIVECKSIAGLCVANGGTHININIVECKSNFDYSCLEL